MGKKLVWTRGARFRVLTAACCALALCVAALLAGPEPARATEAKVVSVKVVEGYGDMSAYAVRDDGTLWGWGSNGSGQIESGSTKDRLKPVKIMDGVREVYPAIGGAYAVKRDGTLWGWGSLPLRSGYTKPTRILDQVEDVQVSGVLSSCTVALKTDGTLWSWGGGPLGDGTWDGSVTPKQVMTGVRSARIIGDEAYAIKDDGSLWVWGYSNWQQGGGLVNPLLPTKVMTGVRDVVGSNILKQDGTVWSLGKRDTVDQVGPGRVTGDVRQLVEGDRASYAIKTDGSVWALSGDAWLGDSAGMGGVGPVEDPVKIAEGVTAFAESMQTNFAIRTDGDLWAWGSSSGILGNGTDQGRNAPVRVLPGVRTVVREGSSTYAIRTDGSLWAWGGNENGRLGDGTKESRTRPVKIMGPGSSALPTPPPARGFSDVSGADWAVREGWLGYAVDNSLMSGLNPADHGGRKLFDPYGKVARAQVAVVLWRLAGSPTGYKAPASDFTDNRDKGAWYYDAVRWAASQKVVTGLRNADGSYTRFSPNGNIWRQDLAVMLHRYVKNVAGRDELISDSKAERIPGWEKVSPYARQDVAWAVDKGLMSGVNTPRGKELQPDAETDRSALAKMSGTLLRDVL